MTRASEESIQEGSGRTPGDPAGNSGPHPPAAPLPKPPTSSAAWVPMAGGCRRRCVAAACSAAAAAAAAACRDPALVAAPAAVAAPAPRETSGRSLRPRRAAATGGTRPVPAVAAGGWFHAGRGLKERAQRSLKRRGGCIGAGFVAPQPRGERTWTPPHPNGDSESSGTSRLLLDAAQVHT